MGIIVYSLLLMIYKSCLFRTLNYGNSGISSFLWVIIQDLYHQPLGLWYILLIVGNIQGLYHQP